MLEVWGNGEHFTAVGPTGSGKTHLMLDCALRRLRTHRDRGVIVLGCKRRDDTLARWAATHRAPRLESWQQVDYRARKRRIIVLWPPYGRASTAPARLRVAFLEAIDHIVDEGDWTVVVDDAPTLVEQFKLRSEMDELWNNGRSDGLTIEAGAQRPVWVSRSMLSQMGFAAAFKPYDVDDCERLGEVLGDRTLARGPGPALMRLNRHEFVLRRPPTGHEYTSKMRLRQTTGPNNRTRRGGEK